MGSRVPRWGRPVPPVSQQKFPARCGGLLRACCRRAAHPLFRSATGPSGVFRQLCLGTPTSLLRGRPPFGATESERTARVAVVALAVVEGILAYPVAGAQVRWSAILFVPVGMLCLLDGMRQLRPDLTVARLRPRRFAAGLLASLCVVAGLAWLASVSFRDLSTQSNGYYANTPVTLLGSDKIRLPLCSGREPRDIVECDQNAVLVIRHTARHEQPLLLGRTKIRRPTGTTCGSTRRMSPSRSRSSARSRGRIDREASASSTTRLGGPSRPRGRLIPQAPVPTVG